MSTNPITGVFGSSCMLTADILTPSFFFPSRSLGLIVHDPDPHNKPPIPYYSLVRLSATPTNRDWYQTNLPGDNLPQWVEDIGGQNARLVARAAALYGIDSDFESDDEEGADKVMREAPPAPSESGLQVHPYRFRLWGLAKSPGDGCTAVLATKHDTQHPDRRGVSNVHFDWQVSASSDDNKAHRVRPIYKPLTTEGRVWEWMYGLGGDVPGVSPGQKRSSRQQQANPLRALFKDVAKKLPCVFCEAQLSIKDDVATCKNRHAFGTERSSLLSAFCFLSLCLANNAWSSCLCHDWHSHLGAGHFPCLRCMQDALSHRLRGGKACGGVSWECGGGGRCAGGSVWWVWRQVCRVNRELVMPLFIHRCKISSVWRVVSSWPWMYYEPMLWF